MMMVETMMMMMLIMKTMVMIFMMKTKMMMMLMPMMVFWSNYRGLGLSPPILTPTCSDSSWNQRLSNHHHHHHHHRHHHRPSSSSSCLLFPFIIPLRFTLYTPNEASAKPNFTLLFLVWLLYTFRLNGGKTFPNLRAAPLGLGHFSLIWSPTIQGWPQPVSVLLFSLFKSSSLSSSWCAEAIPTEDLPISISSGFTYKYILRIYL